MGASIKEIADKIKHLYTSIPIEVLFSIIVILVGFSSFALGALSIQDKYKQQVRVMYDNNLSDKPVSEIQGAVVASRYGTKYYYPWCSGAGRIKPQNKQWYKSVADARSDGKTPAGNCKGLK